MMQNLQWKWLCWNDQTTVSSVGTDVNRLSLSVEESHSDAYLQTVNEVSESTENVTANSDHTGVTYGEVGHDADSSNQGADLEVEPQHNEERQRNLQDWTLIERTAYTQRNIVLENIREQYEHPSMSWKLFNCPMDDNHSVLHLLIGEGDTNVLAVISNLSDDSTAEKLKLFLASQDSGECESGDYELLRCLVVEMRSPTIWEAVQKDDVDLFQWLRRMRPDRTYSQWFSLKNNECMTVGQLAAKSNSACFLRHLFEDAGIEELTKAIEERTEENGGTAIHVAVEERSHLALHVMMSHFEDEDFEYLMTLTNGEGLTALELALEIENSTAVTLIESQ